MALGTRRTTLIAGLAALLTFTAACGTSGPSGAGGGKPTAWALTGGDEQVFRTSFAADGSRLNRQRPAEWAPYRFLPVLPDLPVQPGSMCW